MSQINYESIVSQLKSELNTECAIANRYGIILASLIDEFAKGKVIPQTLLELISSRQDIADELNLNQISSFAMEAQKYYYLFTFSEALILISKLDLQVNLAKFMPNISIFLEKLSKSSKDQEIKEFSIFDFFKEIKNIEDTIKEEGETKEKYGIIKELINYISRQ